MTTFHRSGFSAAGIGLHNSRMGSDEVKRVLQKGLSGLHPRPPRDSGRVRQGYAIHLLSREFHSEAATDHFGKGLGRQKRGQGQLADREDEAGPKQGKFSFEPRPTSKNFIR